MLRSVACPKCKYPNAAGAPVCVNCKSSLVEPANAANQTVRRVYKPGETPSTTAKPASPAPKPGAPPPTPLGITRPPGLKTTDLARPIPTVGDLGAGDDDEDLKFDDEITDVVTPPTTVAPPKEKKGETTQRVDRASVLAQAGLAKPAPPVPPTAKVEKPSAGLAPPRMGSLVQSTAPGPPEKPTPPAAPRDPKQPFGWLCSPPLASLPVGKGSLLTIGRQPSCDLFLAHPQVSRVHARVLVQGAGVFIEDAGSSNGTMVNGKSVTGIQLKPGDVISIGPFEVAFREVPPEEAEQETEHPTSRSLAPVGDVGFAGKIGDDGLAEVLQQLEFNEKTGTLHVESGKLRGKLQVANGKPVSAGWVGDFDEDAVLEMLRLKSGTYRFTGDLEAGTPTMRATITRLLLDASRVQDEGERTEA